VLDSADELEVPADPDELELEDELELDDEDGLERSFEVEVEATCAAGLLTRPGMIVASPFRPIRRGVPVVDCGILPSLELPTLAEIFSDLSFLFGLVAVNTNCC
jgi:hypothetical protein